jgi:hypothetical protein
MTEAWLDPDDVVLFEAMFSGVIHPPLRIIDPLKKNRLRASVSAATKQGYLAGGADAFAPEAGVIASLVDEDTPYVSYTSQGDLREVSFRPTNAIAWQVTSNASRMWLNGALKQTTPTITHRPSMVDPVLPGETVTLTFVVKLVSGTCDIGVMLANAQMGSTQGPTITIPSSAAWQEVSITYTAPADGSVVGVVPYFQSTTANQMRVDVAYGQLENGDSYTGWELGYGAPECVITEMGAVSPRYPMVTCQLTIKEL